MSTNLQKETENKDEVIKDLQKEKELILKEINFLKERYQQADEHKEQMQAAKFQSLNEEINYLKKHYMVEMDVMKQENKNLRMKLRNSNEIQKHLIFEGRNNDSLSPYSYDKRVQD